MRTAFEAEGEIRGTDLLVALVALWREGANGTLQFSRSGATAGFELAAGEIVGTSSSDPRFETAAILLRAGKLDEATLERLKAGEGTDRAQSALQAGVLTRREWRWGEKIRAVEVLSDLLTWLDGEYWLFRTGSREAGEFRLSIPRLVLELFLRSRDRGLVLHYLGGVDVPLVRAGHFDAEFATFGLTPDAESVVRLIDGKSTAAEISSEAPSDAFAVEKLLAALVTLGLVHPEFAAADTAFRPGPRPVPDLEPEEEEAEEREEPEVREDEGEQTLDARPPGAYAGEPPEQEEDTEDFAEEPEGGPELPRPSVREATPEEERGAAGPGFEELEVAGISGAGYGATKVESLGRLDDAELAPEQRLPADLMDMEPAGSESEASFDRPLDMSTGVGAGERPRQRSGAPWVWLLVLLAATVAALLYWRSRGPASPGPASPLAAATTPTTTALEPTAAPATVSTVTAAPSPARTHPSTASPTRPRSQPTAAPTAAPPTPAKSPALPQGRQKWLDRAARDRRAADADRRARFTIQLELACQEESLSDAWKYDRPAGTMWVLTTPFQGKTCFRVLWGRYPTREAAQRALSKAPAFFSTPRNRPLVVPIR